jgi:photosystem II stability/assembly factor-like uncharacterized protein
MKQERLGAVLLLVFLLLAAAYGCKDKDGDKRETAVASFPAVETIPPAHSSEPESEPVARVHIRQMAFANESFGWLAGDDDAGTALWETADSGATWSRTLLRDMYINALYPFGDQKGLMIARSGCQTKDGIRSCGKLGIYGTEDGGATWMSKWELQTEPGAEAMSGQMQFVDSSAGFAIVDGRLLRTRDKGELWQELSLPELGNTFIPGKLAFADRSSGWVLGSQEKDCGNLVLPQDNAGKGCLAPALVYTEDGGDSWSLQTLPEAHPGQVALGISSPDRTSGRLLLFNSENFQASLYATENGGVGWTKRAEFRGGRPYAQGVQFVTPDKGFIPLSIGAGPIEGGLLATEDGGWSLASVSLDGIISTEQVTFTDERNGWIFSNDPVEGELLLKTMDGGRTWEKVRIKKPVKEATAYFAASAWKQAVKSGETELWVKDMRNDSRVSNAVKIISGGSQRTFPWVLRTDADHLPRVTEKDMDGDGAPELVIVFTGDDGTGLMRQEVRVLNAYLQELEEYMRPAMTQPEQKAAE